jgi:hypothetical protein
MTHESHQSVRVRNNVGTWILCSGIMVIPLDKIIRPIFGMIIPFWISDKHSRS